MGKPNPIQWFDAEVTITRALRIMVPAEILRGEETARQVALEMADRGGEDHPDFVQIIEEECQIETLEPVSLKNDHNPQEVLVHSRKGENTHRDADKLVLDWKTAADGFCAEILKQAPRHIERVSAALYEGLLNDVQEYLRENVDYNLSGDLKRARREARRANDCLSAVAVLIGVKVDGFPNYPTPEMIEDQCAVAIAKLQNQAAVALKAGLGGYEAKRSEP